MVLEPTSLLRQSLWSPSASLRCFGHPLYTAWGQGQDLAFASSAGYNPGSPAERSSRGVHNCSTLTAKGKIAGEVHAYARCISNRRANVPWPCHRVQNKFTALLRGKCWLMAHASCMRVGAGVLAPSLQDIYRSPTQTLHGLLGTSAGMLLLPVRDGTEGKGDSPATWPHLFFSATSARTAMILSNPGCALVCLWCWSTSTQASCNDAFRAARPTD